MIALVVRPEGIVLPVKAQPGARKNEIKGEQDGALKVAVTQIAEKGKANKVIVDFLARTLQLRKSQLEILTGDTSHHKQFLVREITLDELQSRLNTFLQEK